MNRGPRICATNVYDIHFEVAQIHISGCREKLSYIFSHLEIKINQRILISIPIHKQVVVGLAELGLFILLEKQNITLELVDFAVKYFRWLGNMNHLTITLAKGKEITCSVIVTVLNSHLINDSYFVVSQLAALSSSITGH